VFTLGNGVSLLPYIEKYYWNVLNSFIPVKISVYGLTVPCFAFQATQGKQGSRLAMRRYNGIVIFLWIFPSEII
jgi:hypothetical protein